MFAVRLEPSLHVCVDAVLQLVSVADMTRTVSAAAADDEEEDGAAAAAVPAVPAVRAGTSAYWPERLRDADLARSGCAGPGMTSAGCCSALRSDWRFDWKPRSCTNLGNSARKLSSATARSSCTVR